MNHPGEYVQPLTRKTNVICPIISGYVTSRLRRNDAIANSISGETDLALFTLENIGTTDIGFRIQQTDDRSVSGIRVFAVSGLVTLVPGGQRTMTGSPIQLFMEVLGTAGPGSLRMQIDAQRRWDLCGFAKDDPFYPPSLFQAKEVPGPL